MQKALITQDYRDRWSELPEGQFDLSEGDEVTIVSDPGIGGILVRKEDGTEVCIAGFYGHILDKN